MSGLTSRQQWTLDRITRCTCGSWLVLAEWQMEQLRNDIRPACPHVTAESMEDAA